MRRENFTKSMLRKEIIFDELRNDRVHRISRLSFASVFTSFHGRGRNDPLFRKKGHRKTTGAIRSLEALLLGKWENGTEGSWNGSQSVIRASAGKIITFAGSDSFRRPIYYFIRLSVVTQGQAKISLRRKGQRRLIYCFARVTLVFITKWINRSVPRCYDIRRATFDQRGDALGRSRSTRPFSTEIPFVENGQSIDRFLIDCRRVITWRIWFYWSYISIIHCNANVKLVDCCSSNLKNLFRKTIQSRSRISSILREIFFDL